MLAPSPHRFWLALALLAGMGCSHTRTIARDEATRDGGGDITGDDDPGDDDPGDDADHAAPDGDDPAGPDGGSPDGDDPDGDDTPDAGDPPIDAPPRCAGATYTTAPSGAACSPTWFAHNGPATQSCYGPAVGTHCDRLSIWVEWGTMPEGFDDCVDPELGFHSCIYPLGEGGSYAGPLTEQALEAVCKATRDFPGSYVICRILGP